MNLRHSLVLISLLAIGCGDDAAVDVDGSIDGSTDAAADSMPSDTGTPTLDSGRDAECGDTQSDVDRCGACDNVCSEVAGGTRTCVMGACGFACDTNRADCDGDPMTGCEVDLVGDPSNCGVCGNVCEARPGTVSQCDRDGCSYVCEVGFADCDGDESNGCEINTGADVLHCGGCDMECDSVNGAEAICEASSCGFVCDEGRGDCDGNPGCEVDFAYNDNNCGSCGAACVGATACFASDCRVPVAFVSSTPLPVAAGRLATLGEPLGVAQAHCNTLAAAAGLPGVFDAWFSTTMSSPSTRFYRSDIGWALPSGTIVASSWADLVDGFLTNVIDEDETGASVTAVADFAGTRIGYTCVAAGRTGNYNVITGTNANGTSAGAALTCDNWNNPDGLARAGALTNNLENLWSTQATSGCELPESCDERLWRVYCFEQSDR